MLEPKRLLILTSRTGGGHLSLALALRDLLAGDVPGIQGIAIFGNVERYDFSSTRSGTNLNRGDLHR